MTRRLSHWTICRVIMCSLWLSQESFGDTTGPQQTDPAKHGPSAAPCPEGTFFAELFPSQNLRTSTFETKHPKELLVREPFQGHRTRLKTPTCIQRGSLAHLGPEDELIVTTASKGLNYSLRGPLVIRLSEAHLSKYRRRSLPKSSLLIEDSSKRKEDRQRDPASSDPKVLPKLIPLLSSLSVDLEQLMKVLTGEAEEELSLNRAMMYVFGGNDRENPDSQNENHENDMTRPQYEDRMIEVYDSETGEKIFETKETNGQAFIEFSEPGQYEIRAVDEKTGLKTSYRRVIVGDSGASAPTESTLTVKIIEPAHEEVRFIEGIQSDVFFAWQFSGRGPLISLRMRVYGKDGEVLEERDVMGSSSILQLGEGEYAWQLLLKTLDSDGQALERSSRLRRFFVVKGEENTMKQMFRKRLRSLQEHGQSNPIQIGN